MTDKSYNPLSRFLRNKNGRSLAMLITRCDSHLIVYVNNESNIIVT